MSSPVVSVLRNVRVPMRDGIALAANVYLPPTDVPAPTLLWYSPYLKDGMGGNEYDVAQRFFAERGFAAVSLDFRGYGESDGVPPTAFAEQEALDGFDALEWLAHQPWSNGRTGIWGVSYGGNTALSVAAQRPPSLRAIVPIHAIDSEFQGVAWPHGCRGALCGEIDWGFRMIGIQLLPPLRFEADWLERWRRRLEALDQPFPFAWHVVPPQTWARWITDIASIEVPTLAVSAWHDSYPRETVDYWRRLRVDKRLILGPWKHEWPDRATSERIGFLEIAAAWLHHHLGDGSTSLPDLAPVSFFETLGRGWRTAGEWPPKGVASRTLYARPEGDLGEIPILRSSRTYRVDPTVGLAALPWDWTTPTPVVAPDISPDDHRAAAWTGGPQGEPLLITGNATVVVDFSSDRPDVPLRAWLSDVRPDGSATLVSQGWVRPTQVLGRLLPSDTPAEVRVPLAPTCYRIARGHRLRLCVAGSHFPALVPAPDPAILAFALGPGGVRVELPVEAADTDIEPAPAWPVPFAGVSSAKREASSHHAVERSIDDTTAAYRQQRHQRLALECGGELTWDLESSAAVARDDPARMRLEAAQTWRVSGAGADVEVRVSTWQTFEEQQVSARIDVDGRRFFERQWGVRFDDHPWRIQR